MPGEPIDSFSVEIIADTDKLITNTQDAMRQIEAMLNDMVNKAGDLDIFGDPSGKVDTITESMKRITAALGDTLETSQLVERSIKLLTDAGMQQTIAFQTLADTIDKVSVSAEGLEALTDNEALLLQDEMLSKVNEGLTIMETAWVDTGNAIPVERLAALSDKLTKIFREGINVQRLSLDDVFARMDEAIVEALVPLERMQEKLDQLSPRQIEFINNEMLRARQAFLDAGEAIPLEKLARLEARLVRIAKLAGSDEKGMAEGFENGRMAVDKLIGSLDNLSQKAERLEGKFKLREQGVAWRQIEENVTRVEEAWTKAGLSAPIEKMETLRKKLERIFSLGLDSGKDFTEIFKQMSTAANDFLPPLKKTEQSLFNIANTITRKFGVDLNQVMGKINGLMRAGTQIASKYSISIAGLGAAAIAVAAVFVAIGAAIVVFIGWAKEGLALALQNSEAHNRLALAVRAHQRALDELAPTQREAIAFAKELADTFNRSNVEMESLVATALFMTRQFKISGDQTLELAKAGAILGTAAGIAPESALRSITQFMLTGYTRGLQRIGIFMDEATLFARAYELGLVTLTGEMDANAKAMAGMSLIMDQANEQAADAVTAAQTYAMAIEESRTRTQEAKEELGDFFKPLAAFWAKIKEVIIVGVIGGFVDLIEWILRATGTIISWGATVGDVFDEIARRVNELDIFPDESIGEFATRKLEENLDKQNELTQAHIDKVHEVGKDLEGLAGEQGETWEELRDRILNASRDIQKALDKLEQKYTEASAKIKQRFEDAKNKIDLDFGRRRTDAVTDLQRDIVDIDKQSQEGRESATGDHLENLFRLEEDHKLKMKRLEEQFMFDIEDAVRERDARGVLSALRRFNQQKKEANQDKNVRTKRLKEDFKNELAEIERQRLKRRAERMLDFTELQDDLALQEARRREDALAAFERAERDLEEANNRRVEILSNGFLQQFLATNFSLNEIMELLQRYLGHGGFVEQLYTQIAAEAASLDLVPNVSLSSQVYDPNNTNPGGFGEGSGYARGGTHFATSPQLLLVGEGNPERIDITPLSQSTGAPQAGFGSGGGSGGSTDINLEVMLEDGLEASLVDQAMDGVAEVLVNIGRKAKK